VLIDDHDPRRVRNVTLAEDPPAQERYPERLKVVRRDGAPLLVAVCTGPGSAAFPQMLNGRSTQHSYGSIRVEEAASTPGRLSMRRTACVTNVSTLAVVV